MAMAKIFRPLRWLPRSSEGQETKAPASGSAIESGERRASRVGTQPVTNTSPSGPSLPSLQEEGWLALLELVFLETGWPDA